MLRMHSLRRWPLLGVVGMLTACLSTPPVQEMSDARQAIAAAEEAEAETHAPAALAEARRLLEVAQRQIQNESFGSARMNAVRAKDQATQALTTSKTLDGVAIDLRQ